MNKITLNHDECVAHWGGTNLNLTLTEFRIMSLLASKPGSHFSYRQIYDGMKCVNGFQAGEGKEGYKVNVRSAIKRLRKKLHPHGFDIIVSYSGFGYCLRRDVVNASCCPTCGQVMIVLPEIVVPYEPTERVPVAHYDRDEVLLGQ